MGHGNHQEKLHESLSALMDGEAGELEVQRLLKTSAGSPELKARWGRYQLAASVLRGERVVAVDDGLAASISAAIEREDVPPQAEEAANDGRSRWKRSLGRGGIAATVALAAILGVQQFSAPETGSELLAEAERPAQQPVQSTPQPSGFVIPAPSTRSVSTAAPRLVPERRMGQGYIQQPPSDDLLRHLNRVMIQHSEQAAHIGSQGMVPFARATSGEQTPE